MKLNNKRTVLVGLAFLSICAFWQMYDNVIPLILRETFHMNESLAGAVMALGKCFPYSDSSDIEAKAKIAELARNFCAEFKARFGDLRCEDIVGDRSHCNEYICAAAELLEKTIKENRGE